MATPKLVIIDAHALIHRAFHALPPMSTKAGLPTNAVYGFTVMLLKALDTLKPTHVAAAFDLPGPTVRSKEYAEYKAHRKPAPEELKSQFDLVRRVVRAFNIPIVEKAGFEADDVVGTLTATVDPAVKIVIVTGDADAFQLIDQRTSVFTLRRGVTDTVLYDEAAFTERYGFKPALLSDYKGLCGDASDNIPGVKGVGDKTARELVGQYGSVEDIFKHLDDLPPRLQGKLKGQKQAAQFSKRLAQIRTDVPLTFSLEAATVADYSAEEVKKVFATLEFQSLLKRLPAIHAKLQPDLWSAQRAARLQTDMPANYHLAESASDIARLKKLLAQQDLIAFDTETDFLGARTAPIVGMSFALRQAQGKPVEAWYVPVNKKSVKEWQDILENPKTKKVGHNLKYDAGVLRQSGIALQPLAFDTMLGSYLLNPGARQHNLDALAVEELNEDPIPITDLIGSGKDVKKMSEVPLALLAQYACEDADFSLRVYEKLASRIKEQGLSRVLEEIEMPLIAVLADMEAHGIAIDTDVLEKMDTDVAGQIKKLQRAIWKQAGGEFNINSTQQLRVILFDKLRIATTKVGRTQTGFSTAAAELDKLMGAHPIIALLSQYRELTKLHNTYITTLPKLVDKTTGRLYTSFNQTVAATGRLSSSDPNLQNIPVRTEVGNAIRSAFVTEKGYVLVKADYSQLELRLAAHIAHDGKMINAFRAGEDIHRATAAWVYGIKPQEVTSEQRRVAKTLNFGVLYGMGPKKFAQESGLSVEEATSFISRYRGQYTGVTDLFTATIEQAMQFGYVETLFGRRRYLPEINSRTPMIRAAAERAAFNFPMQGTEADILKKAMIALHGRMAQDFPKARLLLTVHDELVVEVPKGEVKTFAPIMKEIMESVMTLDVPLVVDVSVGKNWRDMEGVTPQ